MSSTSTPHLVFLTDVYMHKLFNFFFPTKLLTWLMKITITLMFVFTCSCAYSVEHHIRKWESGTAGAASAVLLLAVKFNGGELVHTASLYTWADIRYYRISGYLPSCVIFFTILNIARLSWHLWAFTLKSKCKLMCQPKYNITI